LVLFLIPLQFVYLFCKESNFYMLHRRPSYFKMLNADRTGTTNHILIIK
jgi:hypothetical protein